MFLQEFGDHENIVKLFNVIRAENDKDIYLVFQFMGMYKIREVKCLFSIMQEYVKQNRVFFFELQRHSNEFFYCNYFNLLFL